MNDDKFGPNGPSIYVVVEFAYREDDWEIIFWSHDVSFVRDWVQQNKNMDTYFEYFEVKQLIEF